VRYGFLSELCPPFTIFYQGPRGARLFSRYDLVPISSRGFFTRGAFVGFFFHPPPPLDGSLARLVGGLTSPIRTKIACGRPVSPSLFLQFLPFPPLFFRSALNRPRRQVFFRFPIYQRPPRSTSRGFFRTKFFPFSGNFLAGPFARPKKQSFLVSSLCSKLYVHLPAPSTLTWVKIFFAPPFPLPRIFRWRMFFNRDAPASPEHDFLFRALDFPPPWKGFSLTGSIDLNRTSFCSVFFAEVMSGRHFLASPRTLPRTNIQRSPPFFFVPSPRSSGGELLLTSFPSFSAFLFQASSDTSPSQIFFFFPFLKFQSSPHFFTCFPPPSSLRGVHDFLWGQMDRNHFTPEATDLPRAAVLFFRALDIYSLSYSVFGPSILSTLLTS